MREEQIALGIALRNLETFSIGSFSDRLLVQKKIYLAQSLGVDLGYRYNWYLKGPYSPELTTEAYQVIPFGEDKFEGYDFDEDINDIINQVNELSNHPNKERAHLNEADWYELLASVHYLTTNRQYGEKDKVRKKLIEEKPKYSKEQFDLSWEVLEEVFHIEG